MSESITRRIYELTERDLQKAAQQQATYQARLAECETHRDDKVYWKRRRTTFGLAKRDLTSLALMGDPEWQRGRGQGLLDQLAGLPYPEERPNAPFNAGYYAGYHGSVNELRGWINANPNFAWWTGKSAEVVR